MHTHTHTLTRMFSIAQPSRLRPALGALWEFSPAFSVDGVGLSAASQWFCTHLKYSNPDNDRRKCLGEAAKTSTRLQRDGNRRNWMLRQELPDMKHGHLDRKNYTTNRASGGPAPRAAFKYTYAHVNMKIHIKHT